MNSPNLILLSILFLMSTIYARHTSNWAVLVDTSRFWFNYRHIGNTLAVYRHIKRLGIPDSRIILMIPDDASCSPRNPYPGRIYNNPYDRVNLYGEDLEIDYRGYEVTVENFVRLLTGRLPPSTPTSKRLGTDENSNIFIYLTGHGGNGFIKFQDDNELSGAELADVIEQMWQKKRYHEMLLIVDSCQAASMGNVVYSPNVITVGSSRVGEDSLSLHIDYEIGVFTSDRYSYYAAEFLKELNPESRVTMDAFLSICPPSLCLSTVETRTDLFRRPVTQVPVTDFFASVRRVQALPALLTESDSPVTPPTTNHTDHQLPELRPLLNVDGLKYAEPLSLF